MDTKTQLSPAGLPGQRYSFIAKTEAVPEAGPHTGLFTELSVSAVPSIRHSFLAKTEAVPEAGTHIGLFTELSVFATPGARHSFSPKTEAEIPIVEIPAIVSSGGIGTYNGIPSMWDDPLPFDNRYKLIQQEDREIFEILESLILSGII